MRITHILPALTKGGAEKVAVDLCNLAVAEGHEVAIVAAVPVDPRLLEDQIDKRIKLHFVAPKGSGKAVAYVAMIPWLIRNWHWLGQQDVLHCHLTYAALMGSAASFYRRLRRNRKPAIVETFHGVGMPIKSWQRRLTAIQAVRRDAFALMAHDSYWDDFARDHPALPVAVIANGISLDICKASEEEKQAYRRSCNIPDGAKVIGTVGRLRAERNPMATVAVFAAAARRLPEDVHFLFAGDGPLTEAVGASGADLGIGDRLHLPGLAIQPSVAASVIDVYISVNVGDITGVAGLEAAALGVPVIAWQAIAGRPYRNTDWIWSDNDPEKVGLKAAELLLDPAAASLMAERQSAHVRANHGAETMLQSYMELYRRAGA